MWQKFEIICSFLKYPRKIQFTDMGSSDSKEELRTVDSNGNVNNNIVIQDPIQIHNQSISIVMYIIRGIKIVELALYVYKWHVKRMRRRYVNPNSMPAVNK